MNGKSSGPAVARFQSIVHFLLTCICRRYTNSLESNLFTDLILRCNWNRLATLHIAFTIVVLRVINSLLGIETVFFTHLCYLRNELTNVFEWTVSVVGPRNYSRPSLFYPRTYWEIQINVKCHKLNGIYIHSACWLSMIQYFLFFKLTA